MRIVLVHGAATTGRIWAGVAVALPEFEVLAPDRPCTGDLDRELDALALTYGTEAAVLDLPDTGLLAEASARGLKILHLRAGDARHPKWSITTYRYEPGSAVHLEAQFRAGHEVRIIYETRDEDRWVTAIEQAEDG